MDGGGGDRMARHARLAAGMAARMGASLGDRAPDGLVTPASLGTLLTRCAECPYPGSCAAWQADHPDGAGGPPPYCLNAERLRGIADGRSMEET